MIFYLFHYILVVGLSFLTSLKRVLDPKFILFFIYVLFFVLAAFRGANVDRDYMVYFDKFSQLINRKDYFENYNFLYYEPSFFVIPYLSKLVFGSIYVQMSFVFFAALGIYFKLKSLYLSNSYFLSIVLYLSSWFLLHEMTQIRVGIATGLFYYSLKYVRRRDYFRSLLYIVGALFFHYTAIIFLLVYLFRPDTFSVRIYATLLLLGFFLGGSGISIIDSLAYSGLFPKMEEYQLLQKVGMHDKINVFNIIFLVHFSLSLILTVNYHRLKKYNEYLPLLLKLNCLGLLIFLTTSSIPVIAHRVSELFTVTQIFLYPIIIYLFDKRIIGYIVVLGIAILMYYNYMFKNMLLNNYTTWI